MKLFLSSVAPDDHGLRPAVLLELPASTSTAARIAQELHLKALDKGSFEIIGTPPDELAALWQYVPFDALDFNELNLLAYQLSQFNDTQREDFLSLLAERRQDEEKSLEDVLALAEEYAGQDGPSVTPSL